MKVGFIGLLLILFIGLKLSNIIDWSWFWVLAPVWVFGLVILLIFIFSGIYVVYFDRKKGK